MSIAAICESMGEAFGIVPEPTGPTPPKGYRLLRKGERIGPYDIWFNGEWHPTEGRAYLEPYRPEDCWPVATLS